MTDLFVTNADLQAFAVKAVNLSVDEANAGRKRVRFLRDRLKTHVDNDPGFSLVKMLHAGSVAKGTALAKVNDMDVAVYVRKGDTPEHGLVAWMTERLRQVYGKNVGADAIEPGVHCATITFASGLAVDVVPVLYEGGADDRGFLITKDDGDRLLTSVKLHLAFIKARKDRHPTVRTSSAELEAKATKLLDADPAAQGQGGVLGAYNYNRESAVAHGLPSGVAMYHQAAAAGGHAHNVLTGEQVGHAVLPAITSFDAAFDRLAVFFRWPHGELLPLRYQAIHEMNNLIQAAPPPP